MFRGTSLAELDIVDCWKAVTKDVGRREMNEAVESYGWHDVNEEARNLVQGMEYQGIAPHGDRDRIIAICQAIRANEKTF